MWSSIFVWQDVKPVLTTLHHRRLNNANEERTFGDVRKGKAPYEDAELAEPQLNAGLVGPRLRFPWPVVFLSYSELELALE